MIFCGTPFCLRPFSNAPRKKKKMSHFRKMEIVGLAEKPQIKLFVDIWGPDHPSGAYIWAPLELKKVAFGAKKAPSAGRAAHISRAKMGRGTNKRKSSIYKLKF